MRVEQRRQPLGRLERPFVLGGHQRDRLRRHHLIDGYLVRIVGHAPDLSGQRLEVGAGLMEGMRKMDSDDDAGGRERGRPAGRGAVSRDKSFSASTRWGCSRTGPAFIVVEMTHTLH